jgi:hypothetical protein
MMLTMSRLRRWFGSRVIAIGFAVLTTFVAASRDAQALTIGLDFVTGGTNDIFGVGTTTGTYATFGFTGMNTAQIHSAILTAVQVDYLGYPTVGANPSSPLANGKQLRIDFVLASHLGPPVSSDPEFYFVAIGNNTTGDGFLGQACLGCVRNAVGTGPNFGVANGAVVGSVLVNNIDDLASLASSDAQRINLLAGTVSHEIGHTLSLPHPFGALANPGASAFSLMATGAAPTNMPNGERVKDRAFAYSEFSQLIGAVGVRDVPTVVPEPATMLLFSTGVAAMVGRARLRKSRGTRP